MNGPEENSSLYLPRISVFREVKPTLIKLSKVIIKTPEHAWVIFLKISGGGRGGGRLCYRLLRASRAFTEMENVLTDLSRHKKLPKNLLVYLKLALLRYAHERIRVLISYDLRKFRHFCMTGISFKPSLHANTHKIIPSYACTDKNPRVTSRYILK